MKTQKKLFEFIIAFAWCFQLDLFYFLKVHPAYLAYFLIQQTLEITTFENWTILDEGFFFCKKNWT